MTMPTYIPTGKENAIYSLALYLRTQFGTITPISGATLNIYDLGYEQFQDYPAITISDSGAPQLEDLALGRDIGDGKQGRDEQTFVEINCLDNVNDRPEAERNVRRLRDLLKYAIQMSGMNNQDANGQIMPTIHLLDHNNGDTDTGSIVWNPRDQAASWTETFIKDQSDKPAEKRYRILCKICWHWFE